ncbi:hypothetical protein SmJEL517_g01959 [Synchytrium microbalum]|uniref:Rhamnolipids biosynthesis 3-oxoacyl-[acyl-carrier-protein] reductase n=1 Tax=Synchytrium microbalum TaxID=1806994 RepID=A0A507CDU0_9FUNG|nr:uncharacterized protein SmJEL517_g01959 [Synchytrium microbalum]TPX35735.1 hypothetical protein SmJEL517_g01959 [Synchytrium microbalum]
MATLAIENLFSVKGKVALVTGGGTGIGRMIAAGLTQNGAKVYIASRKRDVVEKTAAELSVNGGKCIALVADLSSKAGCLKLAAELQAREPILHILVNNSGGAWGGKLEDFPEQGWDKLVALNVKNLFYMTVACLPMLEKGANGNIDPSRVINVTSIAGYTNHSENVTTGIGEGSWSYNPTKAAANHLTRIMAVTLAKRNITVNAIAPGVYLTNMTSYGYSVHKEKFQSGQPMGRIGSVDDMAGLALYLSSKASAHLTGAIVDTSGGQSLLSSASSKF